MDQLPLFLNVRGRPVMLVGTGEAADAKARLIERAGGVIVGEDDPVARVAFVALEDEEAAGQVAGRLRARGLLVNVVDRPAMCDFTTPAIVDRTPVLIAIATGGASAGLAKALRQRLEMLLPAGLGALAEALSEARDAIRSRWPGGTERRRAIDAALADGGALDPLADRDAGHVAAWLAAPSEQVKGGVHRIALRSADPDDLTLGQVRLLGSADRVLVGAGVPAQVVRRARADAAIVDYDGDEGPYDPGEVVIILTAG